MCLLSGISKRNLKGLFFFVLPQVLIVGYLVLVLHVTYLGKQIQMFPQHYQEYLEYMEQDDDNLSSSDDSRKQKISEFFDREDTRFDNDEKDENNFSEIAEFDMESLDEEGLKPLDFQKFYHEFLSYNMPAVLRGAAKSWPAFKKWQSDDYLVSKFGEMEVKVEIRRDGENKFAYFDKNFDEDRMQYKDFAQIYKDPNRKANYYWAENNIPQEILEDLKEIEVGIFMNLESTKMWQGASGTESLPHTDDKDNFLCQVSGKKTIVLISPTQRMKLYVGAGKGKKDKIKNYSQVDFFNPDLQKHPLFAEVKGKMKVELNPGDALFIPAFWWHHVKSSKERNLAVNFWYTPNFMHLLLSAAQESGQME